MYNSFMISESDINHMQEIADAQDHESQNACDLWFHFVIMSVGLVAMAVAKS
jgi:hypothetical protein